MQKTLSTQVSLLPEEGQQSFILPKFVNEPEKVKAMSQNFILGSKQAREFFVPKLR
jgi:hypothetical protein